MMKYSGNGAILLLSQLFGLATAAGAAGPMILNNIVPDVSRCPEACGITGPDPGNWTYYHSQGVFKACNQTTLFELNVNNPIDDPDTHVSIRSCTSADGTWSSEGGSCGTSTPTMGDVSLLSWGATNLSDYATELQSAITSLSDYLNNDASCPDGGIPTNMLVRAGNLVAGVYLGSQVVPQSVASVLGNILQAGTSGEKVALQYCPSNASDTEIFGLFLDTVGDISAVQSALQGWTSSSCLGGADSETTWSNTKFSTFPEQLQAPSLQRMVRRGGACKSYTIASGDSCDAIGTKFGGVSGTTIAGFNSQTWGWMGCNDLQLGQVICVTQGTPPMPAVNQNAVCGPQVPGTAQPSDMSTLASLNPCPINACCNVFGQCGATTDFCVPSSTGAPGSAAGGTNGCISNCGLDIVNNGQPPSQFVRIGYFEGYNAQRPCNTMKPFSIPKDIYTHIYYAFANIDPNSFTIDPWEFTDMFVQWWELTGIKKVLSVGGYTFSTDPSTYMIFRNAVAPANVHQFAQNVVNFVTAYNLDGIDFDWEYPGATGIAGIPDGTPQDAANYVAFLQLLRTLMPAGKTISICAPAGYYYLKNYPLQQIAATVDWIVYLTYDLHGQWDYGSSIADSNCPAGNCLRSHTNWTETVWALSMITKGGVPANKVLGGMALYGRSFQMTTPGCYGPMCTYTGPNSGATAGSCTGTAGYLSNTEVYVLQGSNNGAFYDDGNYGDIMVYGGTQWVSFLSPSNYELRKSAFQYGNFAGLVDWAIDLFIDLETPPVEYNMDTGNWDHNTLGSGTAYVSSDSIYGSGAKNPIVNCQPPCNFVFPPWQLPSPTTLSMPKQTVTVSNVYPYSNTHVTDIVTTTISIPPLVTNQIPVWNFNWTATTLTKYALETSILFPPVTLTQPSKTLTTNGATVTIPGVTWTYSPGPWPDPVGIVGPNPLGPPAGTTNNGLGYVLPRVGDTNPEACNSGPCGAVCTSNCVPQMPCSGVCGCVGSGCPQYNGQCAGLGCGQ